MKIELSRCIGTTDVFGFCKDRVELLRSDGAAVEDTLSGTDPGLMTENAAVQMFVISQSYGNRHSYGRLSDKEEPDINVNITVYG